MEKRKAYAYYEERSGRELQVEMGKRLNFPSHLHGELELFLVQSGCVCVGIDGEFRELKAGELAVVFPNTVHSYQCREADSRYMMAVCGTSLLGDYFPSLTQCRPRRPYLCGKRWTRMCCTPCTAFTAAGVPGRTAAFPARCSI